MSGPRAPQAVGALISRRRAQPGQPRIRGARLAGKDPAQREILARLTR